MGYKAQINKELMHKLETGQIVTGHIESQVGGIIHHNNVQLLMEYPKVKPCAFLISPIYEYNIGVSVISVFVYKVLYKVCNWIICDVTTHHNMSEINTKSVIYVLQSTSRF